MNPLQNLSKHFTLAEFTKSPTAEKNHIDNTPPQGEVMRALAFTAAGMERIRAALGDRPIKINSAFRCPALNRFVGGSSLSQHMVGEAVDFTCPEYGSPRQICLHLGDPLSMRILGIDQLIFEGTWVHVSFNYNPRYLVLTKVPGGYKSGVV